MTPPSTKGRVVVTVPTLCVGIYYHEAGQLGHVTDEETAFLKREPNNVADEHAIRVSVQRDGRRVNVGYVSRATARWMASLIDAASSDDTWRLVFVGKVRAAGGDGVALSLRVELRLAGVHQSKDMLWLTKGRLLQYEGIGPYLIGKAVAVAPPHLSSLHASVAAQVLRIQQAAPWLDVPLPSYAEGLLQQYGPLRAARHLATALRYIAEVPGGGNRAGFVSMLSGGGLRGKLGPLTELALGRIEGKCDFIAGFGLLQRIESASRWQSDEHVANRLGHFNGPAHFGIKPPSVYEAGLMHWFRGEGMASGQMMG